MNIIRKTTCLIIVLSAALGIGSVFAQADQANEAAEDAAANANSNAETDSRAIKEGDTITTNGAVVVKPEGSRAQVTTPDAGRADVLTPNRGAAAEGRRNETAAAAAAAARGNGRNQ